MEFKDLQLIEPILEALKRNNYTKATPIQEQTIPLLLDGDDVIGIAQTGTGKTAAFSIPILQKLSVAPKSKNPRALVLAPTRELAAQIFESFKTYGRFLDLKFLAAYGGVSISPQIKGLQKGIDVLIATPGRLVDIMNQGRINLKEVEYFVLDEADRMLDMGFTKDVNKIASSLSEDKQSLFFSATLSREVNKLMDTYLKNPKKVEITPQATPVERIEQCVYYVDQDNKNELLLDLMSSEKMNSVILFVAAKYKADRIATFLRKNNFTADAIHGNKSQHQRTRALSDFKRGKVQVLVATDIAARGIDVDSISHVINYDLPNEPENYVHRIGRTARAGNSGKAYSFCAAQDRFYLSQIERKAKISLDQAHHKRHSDKAKNATGSAAKPKGRSGGRGGTSRKRSGYGNDGFRRNLDKKPRGKSTSNSRRNNRRESRGDSRSRPDSRPSRGRNTRGGDSRRSGGSNPRNSSRDRRRSR